MTRVLILGGAGMLGHKLFQTLQRDFDVHVTVRNDVSAYSKYGIFDPRKMIGGVDAMEFDSVARAIDSVKPEVVVNAIGIVKQLKEAQDPIISISINALFPHRVGRLCNRASVRFIHVGTDCVFSGRKGAYAETDVSDAEDLYGRSKYLGEIHDPPDLTLRTSIIGRELNTANGLVEWFLSQKGKTVKGYRRAIFSGLTTNHFAEVIRKVIRDHADLAGLYHVSADPIDKFSLLRLCRDAFDVDIEIEADDTVAVDRSLDSTRFRRATGWMPLPWADAIRGMANDPTPYDQWR